MLLASFFTKTNNINPTIEYVIITAIAILIKYILEIRLFQTQF